MERLGYKESQTRPVAESSGHRMVPAGWAMGWLMVPWSGVGLNTEGSETTQLPHAAECFRAGNPLQGATQLPRAPCPRASSSKALPATAPGATGHRTGATGPRRHRSFLRNPRDWETHGVTENTHMSHVRTHTF